MNVETAVSQVLDLIQLHSSEKLLVTDELTKHFALCLKTIRSHANTAAPSELTALLNVFVAGVRVEDFFSASIIADECGFLVDRGADPNIAVSRVLDLLAEQIVECRAVLERCSESEAARVSRVADLLLQKNALASGRELMDLWNSVVSIDQCVPSDVKAWSGLGLTVRGAMEMLFRSMEARQAARRRPFFLGRSYTLAHLNQAAWYISRVLGEEDDVILLVLHPEQKRGFRVAAEGLSNNYQLFRLLQRELIGDPLEGMILDDATANASQSLSRSDSPMWTYYQWTALKPDGTYTSLMDFNHLVLGEKRIRDVKRFNDEVVILLGRLELAGGWPESKFEPIHPCHCHRATVIEVLSSDEVSRYVKEIQEMPR